MILEHFRIYNLFSYCGLCEFDLAPTEDEQRNVVIIWGRNGYGKTSFLNSLKLLLSGVSDEIRESAHVGRKLNREAYLLGMGDEWTGAFNRHARAAGEKEFGVSVTWREASGKVTVERNWSLENNKLHEVLRVLADFGDPEPIEDYNGDIEGEARAFIQSRLPDAIMPFFIYDGEKVQQIAEANRLKQGHQIEQILDLADIDVLDEYLGRNLSQWRRASKDADQHTLNALLSDIQATEERLAKLGMDRQTVNDEIEEIEHAIRLADTALQARRQFALQAEEGRLAVKRGEISSRLEERARTFFEGFTRQAPLILHPLLMLKAFRELDKITSHPNRRLKDEVERIFFALPDRLFGDPPLPMPPLTEDQEDFLRRKLYRILDSYRPDETDITSGLFSNLSPSRAESLLRITDDFANNDHQRTQWAQDISDIRNLKDELADIDRKRNDISNLAPQEQEAFQQRLSEREELKSRLAELQHKIGEIDDQQRNLNRSLGQKRTECRQEENKLVSANAARDKLGLGQKLKNTLATYRNLLKMRRREEIETAINKRFLELMTSHKLIRNIKVNEDFSLHYFDAQGEPVGMGNLSAGMKQLVAQSLLWGLKDVSGKEAPVVVDTPLARIDRKHQENLITRYYPKAGPQVIILPTDSELDIEKYSLLKPHVYKEYRLSNYEGDRTQIEAGGYY
ncbi:MAG: DNA sulfur modification protein DndD [Thermodesulfobacteriota bacterium]|nr:DNA sulfur modification protein DndD [Thermodesulfobacteriota bacterium]